MNRRELIKYLTGVKGTVNFTKNGISFKYENAHVLIDIPCETETAFSVKNLMPVLKNLKSEEIEINTDTVVGEYRVPVMNCTVSEFTKIEAKKYVNISAKTFRGLLNFATKDLDRAFPGGWIDNDCIVFTDGVSLVKRKIEPTNKHIRMNKYALEYILKHSKDISIGTVNKHTIYKSGKILVREEHINSFPDYKNVIPDSYKTSFSLNKKKVTNVFKVLMPSLNKKKPYVKIELKDNFVMINDIEAGHYLGDDFAMGFNPKIMMNAFALTNSEFAEIMVNSSEKAVCLVNTEDTVVIAMPMLL